MTLIFLEFLEILPPGLVTNSTAFIGPTVSNAIGWNEQTFDRVTNYFAAFLVTAINTYSTLLLKFSCASRKETLCTTLLASSRLRLYYCFQLHYITFYMLNCNKISCYYIAYYYYYYYYY